MNITVCNCLNCYTRPETEAKYLPHSSLRTLPCVMPYICPLQVAASDTDVCQLRSRSIGTFVDFSGLEGFLSDQSVANLP